MQLQLKRTTDSPFTRTGNLTTHTRTTVQLKGRTMAEEYLGGCLYEDAREVLTDGTV